MFLLFSVLFSFSSLSFLGFRVIKNLFPTFIQVPASGPAKAVQQLGDGRYVKCILKLRKGQVPQLNTSQVEWWEIIQETKQVFPMKDSLEIITFNDLVPPLHLSFFASKGYVHLSFFLFVMVAQQRLVVFNQGSKIT